MVTIKAPCFGCGSVDLDASEITLRIDGDRASYSFQCPACQTYVHHPADASVVRLLAHGGVVPVLIPAQSVIDQEVAAFAEVMTRYDWLDELRAT